MDDTDNARRLADENPARLEMLRLAVTGMADEIDELRAAIDAPLTPAEAMARCPDVAALVTLLSEARSDLAASVDAEYPPDTCQQYPDMARRHHRDMDLCRRIDAALAPFTNGLNE